MNAPMIRAIDVSHEPQEAFDIVSLDYDERFRRRIVMKTEGGFIFLLDLPKAVDLKHDDCLVLEDGRFIKVQAAPEDLVKITGRNSLHLMRIIWHIGNRHLPCQICDDYILIRPDQVIEDMVKTLGGQSVPEFSPFTPEGGAYGFGRTHGHQH